MPFYSSFFFHFFYLRFPVVDWSILIFIIYQRKYGKYSNLPPGPPSLPIFGSIPFLNRENGKQIQENSGFFSEMEKVRKFAMWQSPKFAERSYKSVVTRLCQFNCMRPVVSNNDTCSSTVGIAYK